jgi:hypothetical protein
MILPENYTIQAELLPLMPFKVFGSNGVHIDQTPYSVDGIDFYGCEEMQCVTISYKYAVDKYEHDQLVKQELQCNDYGKYEYYFSAGALAVLCSITGMHNGDEVVEAYAHLYPECVHKYYNFMLKHKPESKIKLSIDGVEFQMNLVSQWENPVESYMCVNEDHKVYVPSNETFRCINTSVVLWEQATPTSGQTTMLCSDPKYNTRRYAVMLLGELYEMAENKMRC